MAELPPPPPGSDTLPDGPGRRPAPQEPRHRIGPYEVLGEVGRGGMGIVYRAWSPRLKRLCALKVLSGETLTETDILRFQNEAMLAARLAHPNIVQVFDAGEDQGLFYLVMEYVEGRGLDTLISTGRVREGVAALAKAARALDYAHRKGVVHRDIKPDNILLDADGEPRVTDFGIAKGIGQDSGLTWAGRPIGTPNYMPPEQANGELDAIGPLSDVYALGATLYHLVAGRAPFEGETPFQVMIDVLQREPEPPSEVARTTLRRATDPDLDAICRRAMEKQAGRRYVSAAALAADLEAWLEGRPVQARPLTARERLQRLLEKNRPALVGGLVVGVVLLLLTASFGTLVSIGMKRTGESLRALGREAALQQAATLERAIRTAMMEGRPEVARELVHRLRQDPDLWALDVLRADGTLAYGEAGERPAFEIDPELWRGIVESGRLQVREERVQGEQVLTVMRPIVTRPECQGCHAESPYVLGVLVVQRSLKAVDDRLRANRDEALVVGGVTALAFLAMLLLFMRLFGIGLPRRRFGAQKLSGSWVDPDGKV